MGFQLDYLLSGIWMKILVGPIIAIILHLHRIYMACLNALRGLCKGQVSSILVLK